MIYIVRNRKRVRGNTLVAGSRAPSPLQICALYCTNYRQRVARECDPYRWVKDQLQM